MLSTDTQSRYVITMNGQPQADTTWIYSLDEAMAVIAANMRFAPHATWGYMAVPSCPPDYKPEVC